MLQQHGSKQGSAAPCASSSWLLHHRLQRSSIGTCAYLAKYQQKTCCLASLPRVRPQSNWGWHLLHTYSQTGSKPWLQFECTLMVTWQLCFTAWCMLHGIHACPMQTCLYLLSSFFSLSLGSPGFGLIRLLPLQMLVSPPEPFFAACSRASVRSSTCAQWAQLVRCDEIQSSNRAICTWRRAGRVFHSSQPPSIVSVVLYYTTQTQQLREPVRNEE